MGKYGLQLGGFYLTAEGGGGYWPVLYSEYRAVYRTGWELQVRLAEAQLMRDQPSGRTCLSSSLSLSVARGGLEWKCEARQEQWYCVSFLPHHSQLCQPESQHSELSKTRWPPHTSRSWESQLCRRGTCTRTRTSPPANPLCSIIRNLLSTLSGKDLRWVKRSVGFISSNPLWAMGDFIYSWAGIWFGNQFCLFCKIVSLGLSYYRLE